MNRRSLLWFGSLALLLLFAAWWFTVMTATAGTPAVHAPVAAPAVLVIASTILFWAGWRKEVSGLSVLASSLFGIGLIGFVQWFAGEAPPWRESWLLLPAFGGAGILIENHLGFGWRFSDRQGILLIFASLAIFLAALIWITYSSGAGSLPRAFEGIRKTSEAAPFPLIRVPKALLTYSLLNGGYS